MLSARYVHLHEALGLGPLWLSRETQVLDEAERVQVVGVDSQVNSQTPGQLNTQANAQAAPAELQPLPSLSAHLSALRPTPNLLNHQVNAQNNVQVASHLYAQTSTPNNVQVVPSDAPVLSLIEAFNLPPDWPKNGEGLPELVHGCTRCELHQQRRNPIMGRGSLQARVVFVAPSPSPDDDWNNELFTGEVGVLWRNILQAVGLNESMVWVGTVVKCAPHSQLNVHPQNIATCAPILRFQVAQHQPAAVVFLGRDLEHYRAAMLGLADTVTTHHMPHPAIMLHDAYAKARAWEVLRGLKSQLMSLIKR